MIYYFLSYLKFLLTSTNQHGVHSPFVYAYVTKCLYGNSPKGAKAIHVFQRSKDYFKAVHIKWLTVDSTLSKQYSKLQGNPSQQLPPFDLVFIDTHSHKLVIDFLLNKEYIGNTTLVLIEGIYMSKASRALWETVKEMPHITVTIDMFYSGALFFRKEQAKEHFKIRI